MNRRIPLVVSRDSSRPSKNRVPPAIPLRVSTMDVLCLSALANLLADNQAVESSDDEEDSGSESEEE